MGPISPSRSFPQIPGPKLHISRRGVARRQIHVAINLLYAGEYPCALTLALAAERQLRTAKASLVYRVLRGLKFPEGVKRFNTARTWLRHEIPGPDEIDLFELDVVVALVRATTLFTIIVGQTTEPIEAFVRWTRERGLQKASRRARPPFMREEDQAGRLEASDGP